MNANAHLFEDIRLENLVRHMDHYEDLIVEACQVLAQNALIAPAARRGGASIKAISNVSATAPLSNVFASRYRVSSVSSARPACRMTR